MSEKLDLIKLHGILKRAWDYFIEPTNRLELPPGDYERTMP
jgi:hypothetical protein